MSALGLDKSALDQAGITTQLVKALILKDLNEGVVSPRTTVGTQLPVVLKKDETVLWIFNQVTRCESKTKVTYEGGSHGVSFRIMKGVSYRVGGSKGRRVENTALVQVGTGDLVVTSNSVYFIAGSGTKRMTLATIVSVHNYDDGIAVTPSRGKDQIFLLDDPIFAANLILKAGALA
jgi:hypothetical protein